MLFASHLCRKRNAELRGPMRRQREEPSLQAKLAAPVCESNDDSPVTARLASRLRELPDRGDLRPGEQLLPERELASRNLVVMRRNPNRPYWLASPMTARVGAHADIRELARGVRTQ